MLIVNERLGLYNMAEFKKMLLQIIDEQSAHVAIELRGNAFDLPSSVIGALVGAQKKMKVSKGSLVLVKPTEYIINLLTLASLKDFFQIADDVAMLES